MLLVKAFLFSFFKLKNYIIPLSLLYPLHVPHPHANHGLWPLFKKLLKASSPQSVQHWWDTLHWVLCRRHDDLNHLNQVLLFFLGFSSADLALSVTVILNWCDVFTSQVQVFGLYSGEEYHETFDCPIKVSTQQVSPYEEAFSHRWGWLKWRRHCPSCYTSVCAGTAWTLPPRPNIEYVTAVSVCALGAFLRVDELSSELKEVMVSFF